MAQTVPLDEDQHPLPYFDPVLSDGDMKLKIEVKVYRA
jgi:hypothetical protein